MKIKCLKCEAEYHIKKEKIPEKGATATCKKCGNKIIIPYENENKLKKYSCPKCNYVSDKYFSECLKCGVIIEKYRAIEIRNKQKRIQELEKIIEKNQEGSLGKIATKKMIAFSIAILFLILFLAGYNLFEKKKPTLNTNEPKYDAESVRGYIAAAEQGIAMAQFNLGLMYKDGTGVPRDLAEAVKWFTKAAEQGLAVAQFNLGVMYEKGKGVPQDNAKAIRWYKKAAEQGDTDAQKNLNRFESRRKLKAVNEWLQKENLPKSISRQW